MGMNPKKVHNFSNYVFCGARAATPITGIGRSSLRKQTASLRLGNTTKRAPGFLDAGERLANRRRRATIQSASSRDYFGATPERLLMRLLAWRPALPRVREVRNAFRFR
jgi:hypothetical protein